MTAIRAEQTLHVAPGDAVDWTWEFVDSDTDQRFNFTGWTARFLARDPRTGAEVIKVADAAYALDTTGLVRVTLTSTFTATLAAFTSFTEDPLRCEWALRLVGPSAGHDEIPVGGALIISPTVHH